MCAGWWLLSPDNQREVLEMRYYRDMSFKEIADQTNVSINTALGRMRYAIINMRRLAERNHISAYGLKHKPVIYR